MLQSHSKAGKESNGRLLSRLVNLHFQALTLGYYDVYPHISSLSYIIQHYP
jgi:hypothetical protein